MARAHGDATNTSARSRPRSHHRRRCSERLLRKHLRQQRRVSPGAAEGLEIVRLIVIDVDVVTVVDVVVE